MRLEDETLRSKGLSRATGEEQRVDASKMEIYDATESKPIGRSAAEPPTIHENSTLRLREGLKYATWNIRSLSEAKLEIIVKEMARLNFSVLGLCEIRWRGKGHFNSNDTKVLYSGHEKESRNGVAVLLNKHSAKALLGYRAISDRILAVRLQNIPMNITIIQTYAPTSVCDEKTIEAYYSQLQDAIDATPNGDMVILMGDLNAKVGNNSSTATGTFGLGQRNDRGDRLIEFCASNDLLLMNTCFQQHKRRLFTWTSPDGNTKNQIDYIAVQKRWKSNVVSTKTYPGADCGSDHELLAANIRLKLKRLKASNSQIKWDVNTDLQKYSVAVKNRFAALSSDSTDSEEVWSEIKQIIKDTAEIHIPKLVKKKKSAWLSDSALNIAQQRRDRKGSGASREEIQRLNAKFQRQARRDKEKYLNDMCIELEQQSSKGRTRDLFKTIKQITGKFTPRFSGLSNKEGKQLIEKEEITNRWKEYTEELYTDPNGLQEKVGIMEFEKEPNILESEVRKAIQQINNNKAPGCDDIPIELIKAGDEEMVKMITKLCQIVWDTGRWPSDWKKSVFVPIFKKGDPKDCSNYRTIALISHTSKVLLKVLHSRMEGYVEL